MAFKSAERKFRFLFGRSVMFVCLSQKVNAVQETEPGQLAPRQLASHSVTGRFGPGSFWTLLR